MQGRTDREDTGAVGSTIDEAGNPARSAAVGQDEEQRLIAYVETWSAPLPHPAILAEYDRAVPNGAERLFSIAERQAYHDMEVEAATVESDNRLAERGQLIGFVAVVLVIALAGYLAYEGAYAAAVAAVGLDVVGLAAVFVYGSLRKRDSREIRVEDADIEVE